MANCQDSDNIDKSIEVRPATPDDYQRVLDINKHVYEGADYVIKQYHDLIKDPDFHYYVCTVDGEVGAFEGVCIVDDGDTLMTRTARVKDKFQGLGLLRHIRKRIYEDFKSAPGKKRIRTSCTNMVRLVHSETFRRANKTVAALNLLAFDFFYTVPEAAFCPADTPAVAEVTLTQFSHLLDGRELMDYLYPQGILTSISWFFDTRSSNVRHLKRLSTYIVASKGLLGFSKGDTNFNRILGGNTRDPSGFLGILSHYASCTVRLASFDIAGTGSLSSANEREEAKQMIRLFLRHLDHEHKKEGSDSTLPILIAIILQDQSTVELFQEIMKDFGFTREDETVLKYTHQYFFEQCFEQLLE